MCAHNCSYWCLVNKIAFWKRKRPICWSLHASMEDDTMGIDSASFGSCKICFRNYVRGLHFVVFVKCWYRGSFNQHGLTLTGAWISNSIHYTAEDAIIYRFPNFSVTIEVSALTSNFIPHLLGMSLHIHAVIKSVLEMCVFAVVKWNRLSYYGHEM